jgi:two-component system response regulator TctD
MTRILLVEDDAPLARGVVALLGSGGYAVDHVALGEVALEVATEEPYGVMILDLGLPDISGLDVLRRLRRKRSSLPVLILTARDAIADRVRGLDEGADDYLAKPFDGTELLARVRALVRRGTGEPLVRLMVGKLTCDPAAQTADIAGRRLELPRREWAVLYGLASRAGQVVPKERLAAEVFSFDDAVGSNALEVYITRLRKKMLPDGPTIRNLRGLGYMMAE